MNWRAWLFLPLFALLLAAVLPWPVGRLVALRVLHRLLGGALLAALAGCVLFACAPAAVPEVVQQAAEPMLQKAREEVPAFETMERLCGSAWPLVAVLLVPAGLIYSFQLGGLVRRCERLQRRSGRQAFPSLVRPAAPPVLLKDLLDGEQSPSLRS